MALTVGDALLPAEMTVRGMSYIEQSQEVRRHGILTNDRPAPRRILRNTNIIFNIFMSNAYNKTTPTTEISSAMSGGPFLPAPAYAMPIDRLLLAAGGVSVEQGLPTAEVQKRYQRFGANQLAEALPVPTWQKFVAQYKDLVIWILIVAAIISGLVGEWADTAAILAIVLRSTSERSLVPAR